VVIDEDPHYEDFDDFHSVFFVDFNDGLQLAFRPYSRPVPPPRLTQVQLRFGPTGQELARYNVHGSDGGGQFTLISGEEHRKELGIHWELAYHHLRPRPFDTAKRQRAWSYIEGSLPYPKRLQEPPRSGLFGT